MKMMFILMISIVGFMAQAQVISSAASKEACAESLVQKVMSDAQYADLNNLTLQSGAGSLLEGMNTLGLYSGIVLDKNGWDYRISFYLDLKAREGGIDCAIGRGYPFSIVRLSNGERVFQLK